MNKQDKPGNRERAEPVTSTEELQAMINKYKADEAKLREIITNSEKERLPKGELERIAIYKETLKEIVAKRETAENELRIRKEAEDNLNQA